MTVASLRLSYLFHAIIPTCHQPCASPLKCGIQIVCYIHMIILYYHCPCAISLETLKPRMADVTTSFDILCDFALFVNVNPAFNFVHTVQFTKMGKSAFLSFMLQAQTLISMKMHRNGGCQYTLLSLF